MNHELRENSLVQNTLSNGDVISPRQFTALLLEQRDIASLDLITMVYNTPRDDDGSSAAAQIHRHLIKLASEGTSVYVGLDETYSHRFAPHSDMPIALAPFVSDRVRLERETQTREQMFAELAGNPNIDLVFHGQERFKLLPFSNIDHRKILRVRGSKVKDFAVIFGFNINESLDNNEIDSAMYLTDPDALAWIDDQIHKSQRVVPERVALDGFNFITREAVRRGDSVEEETIRDIIDGAEKSLLFCGQFVPDGKLFQNLLAAAKRGVKVTIVSNNPSPSRQPLYMHLRNRAQRRLNQAEHQTGNISLLVPSRQDTFVHMKALIADADDPSRARAVTGTDNMTNQLSRLFGQREIMIELTDYAKVSDLYTYIKANVFPVVE